MNIARLALDNIDRYGEYASTWFESRVFTNVENYQYPNLLRSQEGAS